MLNIINLILYKLFLGDRNLERRIKRSDGK